MQPLTLKAARSLLGKEIKTFCQGYKDQTYTDQLALRVPDFKYITQAQYWNSYMTTKQIEEKVTNLILLNDIGEIMRMCCHTKYDNHFDELTFTKSDADRPVMYELCKIEFKKHEYIQLPYPQSQHFVEANPESIINQCIARIDASLLVPIELYNKFNEKHKV